MSKGYELSGLAYFDSQQRLDSIKFQKVKLSDYFSGNALFSSGKLENILTINGQMYDYTKVKINKPFFSTTKLLVKVNLSKLKLRKGIVLDNFTGSFNLNEVFEGSGIGNLNNGPEVKLTIAVNDNEKTIKVYSASAGEVLLRSNIYSSGYGGTMNLKLRQKFGQDAKGTLQISNLRVIGAPFLAKLVSLSSIEGILGLLASNGMVFNEIKADYSVNKNYLTIKNGVATNPSFGITLAGSREMSKKIINYSGVLSPAYSINGLVKKIPLIGTLIGGKEGEGAFGINYFATGALRDPRITVNPLSIITPGQFRELLN